MSALDSVHEISLPPTTTNNILNTHKPPSNFVPFHSKLHHKRNPLKRLPDLNTTNSTGNGCDVPKVAIGPPVFKRSNPLFVVNSLYGIF